MEYVYCGSHLPLLFALSLKNQGKDICVVSFSGDIIKYCKYEKINYKKFEYIRPRLKTITKIFHFKKTLDKLIKEMDDGKKHNFFMTGYTKAMDSYYLAKELSKKGWGVYFTNTTWIEPKKFKNPWYKPIFLRGELFRIAYKILMGLDMVYYTGRGIPYFGIDEKFREKYKIKDYPLKLTHEELIVDVAKNTKSRHKKIENLIVDEGSLGDILKPGTIKKMYQEILEIKTQYTFKKHPGPTDKDSLSDPSAYKLFKNCDEVEKFIPAELLFNSINNSVISVFSAPLITASHFQHIKSISLLNLVDFKDEEFKEKLKENLEKKSKNKIIFPKDFKEFEEILLR